MNLKYLKQKEIKLIIQIKQFYVSEILPHVVLILNMDIHLIMTQVSYTVTVSDFCASNER
jgi:hypothetical protein